MKYIDIALMVISYYRNNSRVIAQGGTRDYMGGGGGYPVLMALPNEVNAKHGVVFARRFIVSQIVLLPDQYFSLNKLHLLRLLWNHIAEVKF